MKNGKKPTVRQCNIMTENGLNHKDWLIVKHTSTEMVIVHRETKEQKTLYL